MATAKKLPSGSWRVQVYKTVNGHLIKKSFTATDKRTAERLAIEWQTEVNEILTDTNITLEIAIDRYLQLKSNRLKPSTKVAYEKYRGLYFQGLMSKKIDKIQKIDIDNEVNIMLARLSSKTVHSATAFVKSVIKYFTKRDLDIEMPQIEKRIYNTPDESHLNAIINAAKDTDMEIVILLASWLGLRHSEISGLKWESVYDDYIVIENAIVKKTEGSTKTASTTRKVLLPKYIKEVLDKLPKKNEYVVTMSYATIGKRFLELLKNNNIPHCRLHDLRHANASLMVKVMPDKYAKERGGWETDSMLQKVYQQTFSEDHKNYSEQFDEFFTKNVIKTKQTNHENNHARKKYRIKKRNITA